MEQKELKKLKQSLTENDYKIIKCMETFLINTNLTDINLPYDIVSLHTERQIARNRINEIEQ
jgi:hypothetical protein